MERNSDEESTAKVRITRRIELKFWKSCGQIALGLLIAGATPSGIVYSNIFYFFLLVFLVWILNCLIRPVLIVFALPFIVFTMGIGMLFINALIIYVAAKLVPEGITVASYWSALWASFWVSFLWWALEMFRAERIAIFKFSDESKQQKENKDDDVIDL